MDKPHPPASAIDTARQIFVVVSAIVALVGLAFGVGRFGDNASVEQSAGGALSDASTLVAPAGPAFSIWTPIYLGLVVLAVWQLAPSRRTDPRLRRTGWLVGLSMLLNALWLLVVEADLIVLSAVVIVALLAVLVLGYGILITTRPTSGIEAVVLDGTMGLYAGWVTAATIANIAAVLVVAGFSAVGPGATAWAVVMVAAAAGIGGYVALAGRGRLAFGVALTWALAWISYGRAAGPTQDLLVAVVAATAAVTVLTATVVVRARSRSVGAAADDAPPLVRSSR